MADSDSFSEIVILSTTNVHGEIDPCGWKKKPLGGLARKATIIDEIKSEGNNPIIVDAGNLFFKTNKPTIGVANDIDKINAEVIVESFNHIGCNGLSIGENDFSNGLSYILDLKKKANFSFLSANIVDGNNELIFDPYVIVERDIRIALIGLASIFSNSDVHVLDPLTSLSNIIEEVRSRSDLVVLLFNSNDQDIIKLQNSDIDIDLILYSKSNGKTNTRASSNGGKDRIPVFTSGNRGKYINKINVELKEDKTKPIDIAMVKNKIKLSKKHLKNKKKGDSNADLDELYKDNQKILDDIAYHRTTILSSEGKIENSLNRLEYNKVPLNDKLGSKPRILLVVDEGMSRIPKGPPIKDDKGRLPGDPHHGHNH